MLNLPLKVFPTPAEMPILWIGISGFSPEVGAGLECAIQEFRTPSTRWRTCNAQVADALMVNGAKTRVTPEGNIRVSPGQPSERTLRLHWADIKRPVAFSSPLASPELQPRLSFEASSPVDVHAVLREFETCLEPLRAKFALGMELIRRGTELRHGIFHISRQGRLLAVLDLRKGRAGLSPSATAAEFPAARWDMRPVAAAGVPAGFINMTPAQLAWTYARRTERDALPSRYRTRVIYFRGAPKVPLSWLTDSQLLLLRCLWREPCSASSLHARTGLGPVAMGRDLACLYFAGAITTTPAKARAAITRQDSVPPSIGPGVQSMFDESPRMFAADDTVPATLDRTGSLIARQAI